MAVRNEQSIAGAEIEGNSSEKSNDLKLLARVFLHAAFSHTPMLINFYIFVLIREPGIGYKESTECFN